MIFFRLRPGARTSIFFLFSALFFLSACQESDGTIPIVEHKKEVRGIYTVVWLNGTAYDMGYQHGELLREEISAAVEYINSDPLLSQMVPIAEEMGVLELAYRNSYVDIINECQGLTDATADIGLSMDFCLVLNFGDVLMEFLSHGVPPGITGQQACSQLAVSQGATTDGRLYHGRLLDWDKIDYILQYPVIFVRQPIDGLAHVYIGFPGNLSPYSGMNLAGLSMASNEVDPLNTASMDVSGRSHVQMLGQILKRAHSLEEARELILAEDHMTTETFLIADGNSQKAAVFEMSAVALGIRETDAAGLVYATNHFIAPETQGVDEDPAGTSSTLRFDRLSQLLPPGGSESLYGTLTPQTLIQVIRDRIDPYTGEESPIETFDNGKSLATNGALFAIIFDPERGWFWVAAGTIPVPQQSLVGFSLEELLNVKGAAPIEPSLFE